MNIYQLTVINYEDIAGYDRKDIAFLLRAPNKLYLTVEDAQIDVLADVNQERKAYRDSFVTGEDAEDDLQIMTDYASVASIEWTVEVPDAPDAPDSQGGHLRFTWDDTATGIHYEIHECEIFQCPESEPGLHDEEGCAAYSRLFGAV